MEAGTHQGWAKCTCPMKHMGFEGLFPFQKLQSEVCFSVHAVRLGKFNFEYSYQRHTKSPSSQVAVFATSCKLYNYIKGAEYDTITWIVTYKKNLPSLRISKK